ncbi:MAG TPA: hypothetical protein EYN66_01445 [Myxococcales bacterium]|nr:hypothetical protein [Myxococcales bacterium]
MSKRLSPSLRIAQISDTHFPQTSGEVFRGVDCVVQLTRLLALIRRQEPKVDLLLVTGDISHEGSADSYHLWLDCLSVMECPVLALPGNHDRPAVMREVFGSAIRLDTVFDKALWRVVALNTAQDNAPEGYLSVRELQRLQQALARASDQSVLIAMHHHPVPVSVGWLDEMGLENADDFWSIIDQYPQVRAVVWGHIHHAFEANRDDVLLWGGPASSVQFVPELSARAAFRLIDCYADGTLHSDIIQDEAYGSE